MTETNDTRPDPGEDGSETMADLLRAALEEARSIRQELQQRREGSQ